MDTECSRRYQGWFLKTVRNLSIPAFIEVIGSDGFYIVWGIASRGHFGSQQGGGERGRIVVDVNQHNSEGTIGDQVTSLSCERGGRRRW